MILDTISSISTDTITALATQPGGAIGVVRVSGSKAIELDGEGLSWDGEEAAPRSQREHVTLW